tara:strand:+ start:534 stop:827 length:294 start_codon:yes stop_codon:yes gene_type:complete
MNDLDICKRIAKIDGVELLGPNKLNYKPANTMCAVIYNPLEDDALCFRLMIKYRIEVFPIGKTFWCAWDSINLDTRTNHDNLNKAICLAIIKVNKGE